ncbi:MAG: ABC transporter permease [Nitrospiraceae bacterium]|nr:ABC transporter permease [Nitrospiraceae bacterium]
MKGFILRKVLLLVPLLFGITLTTFALTKALPGDPAVNMVGERSRPEIIAKMRKEIGADKGVVRQYAGYVLLLLQGEMGRSYYTNRNVLDDIRIKFPNTLRLALGAMAMAIPPGMILGLFAAMRKGGWADRTISVFSISLLSIPVFWSGLMLMLLFGLVLKLLPPSGTGGLRYMLLPALTLSLPALGTIARVTRVSVLEVADMPFIRTARAKGISDCRVNGIHVMKNALIPVVTVIGLDFASYLNGAVLTETIFGWDGIGRFMMEGIIKRDYPVIMGCIIVGTSLFVFTNLAVDILYHYLDPRMRIYETER